MPVPVTVEDYKMDSTQVGLMGVGLAMRAFGNYNANIAQGNAEETNAAFYREQANFARETGERQRLIFDRESVILFGQQRSAFAKAGVDTEHSVNFMASQMSFRTQESYAIQKEADMNVRLATLRAEQADETARQMKDPLNNFLQTVGPIAIAAASLL
jgi:hypothetical protein